MRVLTRHHQMDRAGLRQLLADARRNTRRSYSWDRRGVKANHDEADAELAECLLPKAHQLRAMCQPCGVTKFRSE